jgi:hypothetical protein
MTMILLAEKGMIKYQMKLQMEEMHRVERERVEQQKKIIREMRPGALSFLLNSC